MFHQRESLLKLLRDDDHDTVALVKETLAQLGPDGVDELRDLLDAGGDREKHHIDEVLAEIDQREAIIEFTRLCDDFQDSDLEDACWALSRTVRPGTTTLAYRRVLDQWARRLAPAMAGAGSDTDRIHQLARFFTEEIGLRGNKKNYYKVENSLLPHVLDSKLGIPISLSLIYMFVASRIGLKLHGVNLPGHFILKLGDTFFDPFRGGRILTLQDCAELLAKQNLRFNSKHVTPAEPRHILLRVLTNIFYVAEQSSDEVLQARVARWIRALAGTEADARRSD